MPTLTCPMPHRDDQPREAMPGGVLCRGCAARLGDEIAALPDLYLACGDALVTSGAAEGEKVTHRRDPGLVLSLAAAAARTAIRAELVSWCRIVHDEAELVAWPADRLDAMAAFLVRNLDWLCRQAYADEAARSIHETTIEARRAAYPTKVRRITVGPCPIYGCDGTLTALLRDDADLLPSEIRCDAEPPDGEDRHRWEPGEWMRLGDSIVARRQGHALLQDRIRR